MSMENIPVFNDAEGGGKTWSFEFETFKVNTYIPREETISDIVNFGFAAPYIIIFHEEDMDMDKCVRFAKEKGFARFISEYYGSIVFVYPTCEGGWKNADPSIYIDLIANSKIQQYYTHGVVRSRDRFTKKWGDCFIRGAVFRPHLFGYGEGADYIGRNCMKKVKGEFLWGPAEITPVSVTLHELSGVPAMEREDLPVVSADNSDEVNDAFRSFCKDLIIKNSPDSFNEDFTYVKKYMRWLGHLEESTDPAELGLTQTPGYETVHTSPDNASDYAGSKEHDIGYITWYGKDKAADVPAPTVVVFHGGGDSAYYIAHVSGWIKIAAKYGFRLIAVENHTDHTATEIIELIDKLKKKYAIDENRLYASGFSMGGCKCWDMYQEYPEYFTALAPMDATFEVGLNSFGQPIRCELNDKIAVPVFYAAGEATPLPELPYQADKCTERIRHLFKVNRVKTPYEYRFEDQSDWDDKLWGVKGKIVHTYDDDSRGSVLTVYSFESENGKIITELAGVSGQGHECRQHTCEHAWLFMSQFVKGSLDR